MAQELCWPRAGDIDIMEMVGMQQNGSVLSTYHWAHECNVDQCAAPRAAKPATRSLSAGGTSGRACTLTCRTAANPSISRTTTTCSLWSGAPPPSAGSLTASSCSHACRDDPAASSCRPRQCILFSTLPLHTGSKTRRRGAMRSSFASTGSGYTSGAGERAPCEAMAVSA